MHHRMWLSIRWTLRPHVVDARPVEAKVGARQTDVQPGQLLILSMCCYYVVLWVFCAVFRVFFMVEDQGRLS